MIEFERYPHINDLFQHYINEFGDNEISAIMKSGVNNEEDATKLSVFIWKMVEKINDDEENQITVLGSADNTEMLPDLSYEIAKYMNEVGYYSIWDKVSESNIE